MSKYVGKIVTNQAPAGYSVFFDGTGDYLSNTANTIIPTTGDFTFETWVYPTQVSTLQFLIGTTNNSGNKFFIYISSTAYVGVQTGSSYRDSSTTKVVANAWNHIACTRTGSTYALFVNGVSQSISGVGTMASTLDVTPTYIGSRDAGNSPVTGYLSNVRVCNSVLYTAAFTPPTQLLNITGTSLLTCNSPAIVDQSSNAFAITVNGNSAVSTFTPFTAYVPYNPSLGASTPGVWTLDEAMQAAATRQWNMYDPYFQNTTLLLHGNGTNGAQNNTFLDSSSNNFTITRNGNTTQGSFSPFSQVPGAWSNFFNGSSYLTTASNAAFQFGTGDFTMECWINMAAGTSLTSYWRSFLSCAGDSASVNGVTLYIADGASGSSVAGEVAAIIGDNTIRIYGGQDIRGLGWVHVALTRSGTTLRLFVNGVQRTSATNSSNITGTSYGAQIGLGILAQNNYFVGYVSNVRVVKGTALYTADFTPSVTPLTAVANTSLLTCQTNRFIDNSSNAFSLTVNGTPSVQAFSPFYPTAAYTPATIGGSGYFDGSADRLTVTANTLTGDFTIDVWFYPTAAKNGAIFTLGNYSQSTGLELYYSSSNVPTLWSNGGGRITGAAFSLNTWVHFAVVRSGTTIKMYINGVAVGTTYTSSAAFSSTTYIGCEASAAPSDTVAAQGYISDFRVVNGTAVYTGNFTPPTAPLTNITNTSLLLNFTNAGIVDSTAKNVLETVGNAQISTTQSKFGGSSMYFDGTGDYLQVGPNQLINLGASDFTIEFWIYPTSFASATYPMYSTTARAKADVLAFEVNTSGVILAYITASGGAAWSIVSAGNVGTLTLNAWNHVALVRNGTVFRGYVNGVQGGMTNTSSSAVASFDGFSIGAYVAAGFLTGYIDDLRITRFARYTAAFTPQTSQWQDQ